MASFFSFPFPLALKLFPAPFKSLPRDVLEDLLSDPDAVVRCKRLDSGRMVFEIGHASDKWVLGGGST